MSRDVLNPGLAAGAESGGRIWVREDFLRAITGNSATQETMQAIADQRLAHAGSIEPVDGNY